MGLVAGELIALTQDAEMTTPRGGPISQKNLSRGAGKIRLKGTFGHRVTAGLTYVPLYPRQCKPLVLTLCSLIDELAEEALLALNIFEEFKQIQSEARRLTVYVVKAEGKTPVDEAIEDVAVGKDCILRLH